MKIFLVLFILVFSSLVRAQVDLESDIDMAIQNAKKGIYWALNNIPEKKSRLDNDLIAEDKLFASVKLSKEINGVKIEATGFNKSYAVTIKLFRSDESLIKDGFIKTKENSENSEERK
jgi:predicted nucleotidyltransferase